LLRKVIAVTNSSQAPMKMNSAVMAMPGVASGNMILQKIVKEPAPSIMAASSKLFGYGIKKPFIFQTEKAKPPAP